MKSTQTNTTFSENMNEMLVLNMYVLRENEQLTNRKKNIVKN